MDEDGKIEERKRYNAPFLRAFKYLAEEKMMNQKQFAKVINAESGYISLLKSGAKRVGADYMARLAAAFASHFKDKGHLNMDYLLGKSQYMLVENVPDEEILERMSRGANPDYDIMQKQKAAIPSLAEPPANIPDMSSVFNAAIAAKDDAIESLKRELRTKDELVQSLRDQLAAKDQLIAEQKARLIEYRRIIDSRDSTLTNYPFPYGVAEDAHKKNVSPKI